MLFILHAVTVANHKIVLGLVALSRVVNAPACQFGVPLSLAGEDCTTLSLLFLVCSLKCVSRVKKLFSLCSLWSVTVMFHFSFKHSLIFLTAFPLYRYCSIYRNKSVCMDWYKSCMKHRVWIGPQSWQCIQWASEGCWNFSSSEVKTYLPLKM